jgi:hypothetical protein
MEMKKSELEEVDDDEENLSQRLLGTDEDSSRVNETN